LDFSIVLCSGAPAVGRLQGAKEQFDFQFVAEALEGRNWFIQFMLKSNASFRFNQPDGVDTSRSGVVWKISGDCAIALNGSAQEAL
jgi:hypothetical protein